MKKILLTGLLCLPLAVAVVAQVPSKKMVDEMTVTIAGHIRENYVLPDKGEEIADQFINDQKKGRFYQAKNLKQLDSIMTKSLREASNDFHLFTWNNKEIVQQLKGTTDEGEDNESGSFFDNEAAYNSNFGFEKIEILPENIGYIKLSQINISEHSLRKLYSAMNLVENTDALVIDLRNNGGGGSTIGPVLESYFFDEYLELLEFRSRNGDTNIDHTVTWLLEKRYLKPLYLLINKNTASAAEAFTFALKNQDRCILVGNTTSGGAYMNAYFPVNDDFIVAISNAAPFLPGTSISWEGTGIQPDYEVEDEQAFDKALEIIRSKM